MKRIIFQAICLLLFFTTLRASDNEIMQAMRDEIARSAEKLEMDKLERPYFIEYKYTVKHSRHISAEFGSVTSSTSRKSGTLDVGVRVGDYKFDNTKFSGSGGFIFGGGSRDDVERFSSRPVSFEPDYDLMRRELWLATDAAYKKAAEDFSKKKAVLKNRTRKDTTWDFLKLPPAKHIQTGEFEKFDNAKYEDIIAAMSGTYLKYPEVFTSRTSMEYLPEVTYYVNSEGREYIKYESKVGIETSGSTQAEDDGMVLTDFYSCYTNKLSELPSRDSLIRAAENVPKMITKLRNAEVLERTYAGPVIFSGQAAAELFAQVFAPNLSTRPKTLSASGFPTNDRFRKFQYKVGGRVLPEFLSVEAVPTKPTLNGTPLFGKLEIDDEGVQAKDFTIVDKGYLKDLFSSRVPTRRIRHTNGHKRGGGSSISNIVVDAVDKDKILSYAEMKKKMAELCKARELEYGLVVKRVMNSNIFSSSIVEQIFMGDLSYMRGNSINLCEVYKVYPDGREELIRGAEGAGFTVQSFKDIIYSTKEQTVYNYWASGSGYGNWHGGTIAIPDILFEDAEIRTIDRNFKKAPFVPGPLAR